MQLALAAVTFESQAEVYNAIHAADAKRLKAFEMSSEEGMVRIAGSSV